MKKSRFIIGLALLSLGVTSCKEDYFDSEEYNELVKRSFPVKNVDGNHTWATIGSASAKVNVNLNGNETYQVRIYDKNPIGSAEGLTLLGQGTVTDGQTMETAISYPLSRPYAFVTLFDSKNYMSVYPQAIEDGKLVAQIGGRKAASARGGALRAQENEEYQFPSMPGDDAFPTAVPKDAQDEDTYYQTQGGNYFIKTSDNGINVWNGNANLYFDKGTYNITSIGLNNNTNFYLLPGANVTMPGAFQYKDVNIYIAKGATLNIDINAVAHFYNKGTIVSNSINIYSVVSTQYYTNPNADNGIIINDGDIRVRGEYHVDDYTMSVNNHLMQIEKLTIDEDAKFLNTDALQISDELGVKNDNSLFINRGTVTAASVGVEGSANFYNESSIDISGYTVVNSNQCTWHNDGTYETDYFTYQAGSTDVINNCRLIVNELFYIGLGDTEMNRFKLNGGGSVVTKDFHFDGPGFLDMGGSSLFRVTGTAYMGITKDVYGIYGPAEGDYAVFQAREIVRADNVDLNQGFVANYFNHLYVATDNHFNFGYSDKSEQQQEEGEVGMQPYYRLDSESGARFTTYNGADVEFTDNGCGAAYEGEPEEDEPDADDFSMRFCFEDNFPQLGDYDFNDAVFTVTPTINGRNVDLRVSLDAVGATEQVGAALHIAGLTASEVESFTKDGSFDEGLPSNAGSFDIIPGEEGLIIPDNLADNFKNAVVIKLTSNVHWALARTQGDNGMIQNWFYNTVERTNDFSSKLNDVAPRVVTYHFTLTTEEAAQKFVQDNFDLFITEGYNSGWWEVHTFPFKYDQVLGAYYDANKYGYETSSFNNFPWAICVPGTFKYPIEWQNIGFKESNEVTGAYQTMGHSFGEWAEDHEQATDWYEYPEEELIFK